MKQSSKVEDVDSDTSSVADTEYSSESEVEQYLHDVAHDSQRRFSLSDAQIALSYVQAKMEQRTFYSDGQRKARPELKDYYKPKKSSSYSSFHRPERTIIRHKMELDKKDGRSIFNIYTSNVDFLEHPISISMIEDTPTAKVIPAKDDNHCRALRSRSNGMFPSLPPSKPPPLQVHTSASRKPKHIHRHPTSFQAEQRDFDVSNVTHVGRASSVVVDMEDSNDCCNFLRHGR